MPLGSPPRWLNQAKPDQSTLTPTAPSRVQPLLSRSPNTVFVLGPFWAWHLANAFEDKGRIIVDFPWWSSFGNAAGDFSAVTGAFSRLALDLATGTSDLTHLDSAATEFPRIDDRRTGRPTGTSRWWPAPAGTGSSCSSTTARAAMTWSPAQASAMPAMRA